MCDYSEIKTILISDDVNEKAIQILENNSFLVYKNTKLSKQELINEARKYDCLIVRSATKVTGEVLREACADGGKLKLVGRAGTGVES